MWMLGCEMERRRQAEGVAWGTMGGMDIETHFLCIFCPLPFSENYQLLLEIQIQKNTDQMWKGPLQGDSSCLSVPHDPLLHPSTHCW